MHQLEELMNSKISVGFYHIVAFLLLVLIDLTDGGNIVIMSITLPIIQTEFLLSTADVSVLTSIYFIGTSVGSLCVGKFSDQHGRRTIIMWGMLMQVVICVLTALSGSFWSLVVLRFFFGFSYGFSLPLTTVYITELMPSKQRGKWILFVNFFMTIGKLYGTLLAYGVLTDLKAGDWRRLVLWSALMPAVTLAISWCFLLESMRFSLVTRRFTELHHSFNQIVRWNNKMRMCGSSRVCEELTPYELTRVIEAQDKQGYTHEVASYSMLFTSKWLRITLLLWAIYFNLNSMFYGQMALLPYLIIESNKGILSMFTTILGEVPVIVLTYYMIDHVSFGRRKSVLYFSLASAVAHFLPVLLSDGYLTSYLFLARFSMKGTFACVYPLASEVYPTSFRTVGYGMANAFGRIGACLMPFFVFPLLTVNGKADFILFGTNALICALGAFFFPVDTTGKILDVYDESFVGEVEMANLSADGRSEEVD